MISKGLRTWFVIHFAIDILFAIPLLVVPVPFLTFLGWTAVDPFQHHLDLLSPPTAR